ncbi:MAG: glycosyltransferase [Synergistaceae bacterium]|jgi:glycosyltransferase involved in cell wall biosynthesis|nr:glycosyltransferase [Synergistaceae bacterium]
MMDNPVFSIVTVCLNAASTLRGTIESVLGQNYPHLEYIVVDGGSTDGTREILDRYKDRLAKAISEPDDGIYDAFNKGVELAAGEIIGILNTGDRYAPWALSTVAEAARAHPECGVFHGKLAVIDETLSRWTVYPLGNSARLPRNMSIAHPATFVRKKMYEKHGLFDAAYKIAGDWDFALRLYLAGERFCPIDTVLTAFDNAGVSSVPSKRLLAENRRVCFRHLRFTSALRETIKGELRYRGRKILDLLGGYRAYVRYRDKRLLKAEASGAYTGSLNEVWNALRDR